MRSPSWELTASDNRSSVVGMLPVLQKSVADGGGRARCLRRQADRVGMYLIGGFGLLVEAAVLVAHEHIHRTINALVRADDRPLEECLDKLHFRIVWICTNDDGLLNLFDGIGGQR